MVRHRNDGERFGDEASNYEAESRKAEILIKLKCRKLKRLKRKVKKLNAGKLENVTLKVSPLAARVFGGLDCRLGELRCLVSRNRSCVIRSLYSC
jgi:hypothetical protein